MDADCDTAGGGGDGAVVAEFGPLGAAKLPRGEHEIQVTQENITYPKTFTVTGTGHDVAFTVLETAVQAGLTQDDCPLATDKRMDS